MLKSGAMNEVREGEAARKSKQGFEKVVYKTKPQIDHSHFVHREVKPRYGSL